MFLQPALLARAGLYTVAMMGSIAFVGARLSRKNICIWEDRSSLVLQSLLYQVLPRLCSPQLPPEP